MFYPATIRNFLLFEHSWKDYPGDWLLLWKKTIARDVCLGLGLPDPTFAYPEETSGVALSASAQETTPRVEPPVTLTPEAARHSRLPIPAGVLAN